MMRRSGIGSYFAVALMLLLCASTLHGEGIKGREILGVRIGAALSSGVLNQAFGQGTEIEIHFIEGIGSWFGVTVALSSHNFGESKDLEKNLEFTGSQNLRVDLEIYSITVGFLTHSMIGQRFSATTEAGGGLYTINAVIPAGFLEGHITDNQYGLYGGAGILYHITKNVSLNLNGKYHYVFSGKGWDHPLYFYTGRERTQYYQIAFGIMIRTG